MHPSISPSSDQDFSLPLAVIVSLILHVGLGIMMMASINQGAHRNAGLKEESFIVSILPPPEVQKSPKEKQQIVSSSPVEQLQVPPVTNRIAEVDSSVVKEQIKRGQEFSGAVGAVRDPSVAKVQKLEKEERQQKQEEKQKQQHQPAQAEQSRPEKDQQKRDLQKETQPKKNVNSEGSGSDEPKPEARQLQPKKNLSLNDLTLDQKSLISNFSQSENSPKSKSEKSAASARQANSGYKAFSRPAGSGARFMGQTGSSDYLPNLPDGDITLLNAKANQFAVFVRRVAIQVFAQIRSLGWDSLNRGDIERIRDFSTVIAVMSPKGELISVSIDGSSASEVFDSIIVRAAKAGTKDPNPPEAARAADGNIRFIFKARSWVETGRGRGGMAQEMRWILLSTGLE